MLVETTFRITPCVALPAHVVGMYAGAVLDLEPRVVDRLHLDLAGLDVGDGLVAGHESSSRSISSHYLRYPPVEPIHVTYDR